MRNSFLRNLSYLISLLILSLKVFSCEESPKKKPKINQSQEIFFHRSFEILPVDEQDKVKKEIKKSLFEDLEAAVLLFEGQNKNLESHHEISEWLENHLEDIFREDKTSILYNRVNDPLIIGFISFDDDDDDDDDSMSLELSFFLKKDYRGQRLFPNLLINYLKDFQKKPFYSCEHFKISFRNDNKAVEKLIIRLMSGCSCDLKKESPRVERLVKFDGKNWEQAVKDLKSLT